MLYICSYVTLSSRGCYVPAGWGLSWVKWYNWAPQGFASGPAGIEYNRALMLFYLPLWLMGTKFVHTQEKADNGQYPINRVLDAELRKSTQVESLWDNGAARDAD